MYFSFIVGLPCCQHDVIFISFADESEGNATQYARVPVQRLKGRFGTVTLSWSILEDNSTLDLDPIKGTLTFYPGEGEKYVETQTKADEAKLLFSTQEGTNTMQLIKIEDDQIIFNSASYIINSFVIFKVTLFIVLKQDIMIHPSSP